MAKTPTHDRMKREGRPDAGHDVFTLGIAALIYFGLALLYLLPAFLPGRHIYGTDYFAGAYFMHDFVSNRIAGGALPKWVPGIYGGSPLFANAGSAFYPVRWLADLVFPTSKIFPTIYLVQFGLAGVGMYLLCAELDVRRWIAFVIGLAFEFTGLAMSFVYAGHDGRIIVATLAPMFFFFLHRGVRTGRVAPFAGAAATIGFCLLSNQIQSCYYLLLGGAIWAVFCLIHHGVHRDRRRLGKTVALGLGAIAFGFALTSVNFLPFSKYVPLSNRGEGAALGYDYSTSWSLPPDELIGIAVPENKGVLEYYRGDTSKGDNIFKLDTQYVGALVVALLILGFGYSRGDRRWWFFLGLSAFAVTIALGGHTPLYRLYYAVLPGTKKFRAPSISFLLVSMSLVAMAGLTMEALARRLDQAGSKRSPQDALPNVAWWLVGIVVAAVLILAVVSSSGGATPRDAQRIRGWFRFACFLTLTVVFLWAWLRRRLGVTIVALGLGFVTVSDLWLVDRRFFETRPPPSETFAADDIVDFLKQQPGPFRAWPLPVGRAAYPHEPNYLSYHGIDQVGGEAADPLQRYLDFIGSVPGTTSADYHNLLSHPQFLAAANVRYLITGAPIQGIPFPVVHSGRYGTVYENPNALPRARLVPNVAVAADDSAIAVMSREGFDFATTALLPEPLANPLPGGSAADGTATIVEDSPDEVVVTTDAPRRSLLVLADNWYPDWQVTIDGEPAPLLRADYTFRGVVVDAGQHRVAFRFHPKAFYVGFWIWVAGLALLTGYGLWLLVRHWRRPGAAPAARPAAA